MQIPRGDLVAAFKRADWIAERRHHVQQHQLRMKAAGQPSGLAHDMTRIICQNNGNKNSLNVQHDATYR